ncbi:hypothetical protein FRC12_001047 [Ceratobasidium sp. 428]|nr:hypothetical protein FRC12_001047 [Ceratobasidium sp. 428]
MDPAANTLPTLKQKRAAKRRKDAEISAAVLQVEEKVDDMLLEAAEGLGVDAEKVKKRFSMHTTARSSTRVSVWNGLMHEVAQENQNLKAEFPGRQFMNAITQLIKDKGLYEKLTEEQKKHYLEVAQKKCDERLTAGTKSDGSRRRNQGTVKKDLSEIGLQASSSFFLDRINELTGVESVLIAVKGDGSNGLKPVYFASDKARRFMESHVKLPMKTTMKYMEKSVLGGASGIGAKYKDETQAMKASLRTAMVESLRKAALSIPEDNSPSRLENPESIACVQWSKYWDLVSSYRVEAFNWPMKPDGSMKDPSQLGCGLDVFARYLEDVKEGKRGFRRLTDEAWEAKMKRRDELVEDGTITVSTRKVCSDKGTQKKRPAEPENLAETNKRARISNRKSTRTAANNPPVSTNSTPSGSPAPEQPNPALPTLQLSAPESPALEQPALGLLVPCPAAPQLPHERSYAHPPQLSSSHPAGMPSSNTSLLDSPFTFASSVSDVSTAPLFDDLHAGHYTALGPPSTPELGSGLSFSGFVASSANAGITPGTPTRAFSTVLPPVTPGFLPHLSGPQWPAPNIPDSPALADEYRIDVQRSHPFNRPDYYLGSYVPSPSPSSSSVQSTFPPAPSAPAPSTPNRRAGMFVHQEKGLGLRRETGLP